MRSSPQEKTGASFAGTITTGTGTYLLDETNRTITIMVWKPVISDVGIKLETASGFSTGEILVANTVTNQWEELTFDFSDVQNPPEDEPYNGVTVFPDFQDRAQENVIFFDNITYSEVADDGGNGGGTEGNLLTNGDFEAGDDGSWFGNALDIRTEGGNSFNFADVEVAGNPFDVNLSQVVDLIPGESYTLTFDASTGAGNTRDMLVGIGLNQQPFYADVEPVTLTETTQTFTVELAAIDDGTGSLFGDAESRVIFDMGADVGVVVIDNVSLELAGDGGGQEGDLVTNGDFEAGDDGSWFGNALDIRTEGGNSFNFADVEVAGNPFDVNLSQVVDLIPGESYTLTFDASTGAGNTRDMLVGIGLNQQPFYADVEPVTLTETTQTFTVELAAIDDGTGSLFGDEESRVIFDMGADVGVVVIDNVSLSLELATSVEELDNNRPNQFTLNQNYPNPFNPTTNITFTIPQSSDVKLEVFNAVGQKVATLVNGVRNAGSHTITFDASRFASGVYLYRLTSGNSVQVNKMLLLK